jgi:hypothetical protein
MVQRSPVGNPLFATAWQAAVKTEMDNHPCGEPLFRDVVADVEALASPANFRRVKWMTESGRHQNLRQGSTYLTLSHCVPYTGLTHPSTVTTTRRRLIHES